MRFTSTLLTKWVLIYDVDDNDNDNDADNNNNKDEDNHLKRLNGLQ